MKRRRLIIWGIVIAVVAGGMIWRLSRRSTEAPDQAPNQVLPEVATVMPVASEGRITLRGSGTVRPLREVTLVAEVAGKITWIADDFVTGGAFRQGEAMLQIDSTDYVNAVTLARAEVVQRQLDLLKAEEEMAVSKEEWTLLEDRTGVQRPADSTTLGSLVLKEPQRHAAAAQLESAHARLRDAEARLERTRITAPFNGRVRSKGADLGQFVGPGQAVASYFGTDVVEVDVPIAGKDVLLLGDLILRESASARARLVLATSGGVHEWQGIVHRTEGALTEATRTLSAVIRVRQPYEQSDVRPPLLVGTFVTAILEGRRIDRYYKIPRQALRAGDAVWVVRDGRLYSQSVEILQEVEDTLLVTDGVTEADSVVTSVLEVMIDGMRVRVQENQ